MIKARKIDDVIRIVHKTKPVRDVEYWQSQPPEKRLEVVEEIRNEYHNGNKQRLQRIYRIIKRTQK